MEKSIKGFQSQGLFELSIFKIIFLEFALEIFLQMTYQLR